jgi:hypothetical protein
MCICDVLTFIILCDHMLVSVFLLGRTLDVHTKPETLWLSKYTVCPTRYRTHHLFNNSNTNEDIATKFEQEYVLFFHISYTMR